MCKDSQGGSQTPIQMIPEKVVFSLFDFVVEVLLLLLLFSFFLFLFGGIILSIISLAKFVVHLLENYPVLLWSFFFGLIIASVWLIGKSIAKWNAGNIIFLIFGSTIAFYISTINSVASVESYWFIVLSGAIAICAMILPGISGSFILVLLGSYKTILSALKDSDFVLIGLFVIGCVIGLMSFARLLKILFEKYKEITIALHSRKCPTSCPRFVGETKPKDN